MEESKQEHTLDCTYQFVERIPGQTFVTLYNRIVSKLTVTKTDCNTFRQALRLFRVPATAILGFPVLQTIRIHYGQGIGALYIFKLHYPHKDGYTHGIHLRLNGFVNRRIFEHFITQLVATFAGEVLELKPVVPIINKSVSLYDYLATLYVVPTNLYVSFFHPQDAIALTQVSTRVNNTATANLKNKMVQLTLQIADNIIAMPSKYSNSYLFRLLSMNPDQFRTVMRQTNLKEVMQKITQDAYNIALQDKKFKTSDQQELMEPMTRRSMLNRCSSDKAMRHTQELIQQQFGNKYIHPHPYNGLIRSDYGKQKAFDGMIFDPKFLFILLLVARWFVRSCMLKDKATNNNHVHLMLYGNSGTGKSLILSTISQAINTYKFLVGSKYQNPDLLESSIFSIEEFNPQELASNEYKALLDLKSHVKIDFKHLNPENATEGVPFMITSNNDAIKEIKRSKYGEQSALAAMRRLYLIPMKGQRFETLHGKVSNDSPNRLKVIQLDHRFDKEPYKLERMFNLIIAFSLYQQDMTDMYLDHRMHQYFYKTISDFKQTVFGTFYITNKQKVDEIIQDVELTMMQPDIDDASYLMTVSSSIGRFQQLASEFIMRHIQGETEDQVQVFKDRLIPWPIKIYYLLSNYKFSVKMMWEIDNWPSFLNEEVDRFLKNPNMEPYKMDEYADFEDNEQYSDLKDVTSSSAEEKVEYQEDAIPATSQDYQKAFNEIEEMLEDITGKRTLEERFGLEKGSLQPNEDTETKRQRLQ